MSNAGCSFDHNPNEPPAAESCPEDRSTCIGAAPNSGILGACHYACSVEDPSCPPGMQCRENSYCAIVVNPSNGSNSSIIVDTNLDDEGSYFMAPTDGECPPWYTVNADDGGCDQQCEMDFSDDTIGTSSHRIHCPAHIPTCVGYSVDANTGEKTYGTCQIECTDDTECASAGLRTTCSTEGYCIKPADDPKESPEELPPLRQCAGNFGSSIENINHRCLVDLDTCIGYVQDENWGLCTKECKGDFGEEIDKDSKAIEPKFQCPAELPQCEGYDKDNDTKGTCTLACITDDDCPEGPSSCVAGYCKMYENPEEDEDPAEYSSSLGAGWIALIVGLAVLFVFALIWGGHTKYKSHVVQTAPQAVTHKSYNFA